MSKALLDNTLAGQISDAIKTAFVGTGDFDQITEGVSVTDAIFVFGEKHDNAFARCNLADVSEESNVVDGLMCIASAIRDLAKAIREAR